MADNNRPLRFRHQPEYLSYIGLGKQTPKKESRRSAVALTMNDSMGSGRNNGTTPRADMRPLGFSKTGSNPRSNSAARERSKTGQENQAVEANTLLPPATTGSPVNRMSTFPPNKKTLSNASLPPVGTMNGRNQTIGVASSNEGGSAGRVDGSFRDDDNHGLSVDAEDNQHPMAYSHNVENDVDDDEDVEDGVEHDGVCLDTVAGDDYDPLIERAEAFFQFFCATVKSKDRLPRGQAKVVEDFLDSILTTAEERTSDAEGATTNRLNELVVIEKEFQAAHAEYRPQLLAVNATLQAADSSRQRSKAALQGVKVTHEESKAALRRIEVSLQQHEDALLRDEGTYNDALDASQAVVEHMSSIEKKYDMQMKDANTLRAVLGI